MLLIEFPTWEIDAKIQSIISTFISFFHTKRIRGPINGTTSFDHRKGKLILGAGMSRELEVRNRLLFLPWAQ